MPIKEFSLSIFRNIMSDLEVSEAASTDCMYDSLRYSFPIELGELVDQVKVCEENGTSGACSQ
jgi:hypothetical protein